MYSTEGGMNIEDVAHNTPHLIFKEEVDPSVGLQSFQARNIAFNLGLSSNAFQGNGKICGGTLQLLCANRFCHVRNKSSFQNQ